MLVRRLLFASLVFFLFAGSASAAWFLKIGDTSGPSTDPNHRGWIELDSFNLGGQTHATLVPGQTAAAKNAAKGSGKMFLKFTFKLVAVKTISWAHDDESPKEKSFSRALLEGTKPDGRVYVRFVLHDCVVSDFRRAGGGKDGAPVTDSMNLSYSRADVEDLEPPPTPTHVAVKPVVAAPKK